jgi:hypothetical protein
MDRARILAYITGTVDQELLARNEYLAAENRILKAQLKGVRPLANVLFWAHRFEKSYSKIVPNARLS